MKVAHTRYFMTGFSKYVDIPSGPQLNITRNTHGFSIADVLN